MSSKREESRRRLLKSSAVTAAAGLVNIVANGAVNLTSLTGKVTITAPLGIDLLTPGPLNILTPAAVNLTAIGAINLSTPGVISILAATGIILGPGANQGVVMESFFANLFLNHTHTGVTAGTASTGTAVPLGPPVPGVDFSNSAKVAP